MVMSSQDSPLPEDEDDEEIPPPDDGRVAARLGVLLAIAYRAYLETADADAKTARSKLLAGIAENGIEDELEPKERTLLELPIGQLSPMEARDASWSVEPAVVMAWSLRLTELPPYDVGVTGALLEGIDFLEAPWPLLWQADLREQDELEAGWASALTVHWRLREYGLRPTPIDLRKFVRTCKWAPMTTKGLKLRGGDLLLRGQTLAEAGDVFDEVRSIAQERHRAFEWLIGGNAVLWSKVTADT